jgi:hypothetical protein
VPIIALQDPNVGKRPLPEKPGPYPGVAVRRADSGVAKTNRDQRQASGLMKTPGLAQEEIQFTVGELQVQCRVHI